MPLTKSKLNEYPKKIVGMSGGKDSLALVFNLLDLGVNPDEIELWHHEVDGREGSTLMDWPITNAYCQAFADTFGIKIYYSWLQGGFERNILKKDSLKAPTIFQTPDGEFQAGGKLGKPGTRMKFPLPVGKLSLRSCSSDLKIDVMSIAINNQERFLDEKTLILTGERAEESTQRANYEVFENHRTDNRNGKRVRRHVDVWRSVHSWKEQRVWDAMKSYGVNPHPAYWLGWNRVSCAPCIFGNADQWASLQEVNPAQFNAVAAHEKNFGVTIKMDKRPITEHASCGKIYEAAKNKDMVKLATSREYTDDIIVKGEWRLPPGAFGEGCGPS